ncbi:MAG: hypothetical protein ACR2OM_07040, partial [Aestuariivirgaceae bacterium]
GGLFQRMSSFQFGFLVFGITTVAFVGWTAITAPQQLRTAFANPSILLAINVSATLSWAAYLTSVQLIEPAVAYTIGAGTMPLTAYVAYRFGVPEGEAMRNRTEAIGNVILLCGIVYLATVTVSGSSGFVRGDAFVAALGVGLAIAEGILFTALLIYCLRLDRAGVTPGAVFGLRFPLYALVAGGLAGVGADYKGAIPSSEIMIIVVIGLALVIPPLFALQKAVAAVSTMTIGALTALGPFVIFILQMIEGRVEYSQATLIGLFIFFTGSVLTALGAVRAVMQSPGG